MRIVRRRFAGEVVWVCQVCFLRGVELAVVGLQVVLELPELAVYVGEVSLWVQLHIPLLLAFATRVVCAAMSPW